MLWLGIDYGSKMAGTTAVCWQDGTRFIIQQSAKKKDADEFLLALVAQLGPRAIYLDAPLSLPSIYSSGTGNDYFYRECDKQLKAMSPMFIGGLAARAIKLKHELEKGGVNVHEVYPAALVRSLALGEFYKKDLEKFSVTLEDQFRINLPSISNWHQADAVLAWAVGKRHQENIAKSYGRPTEGTILA